MRIITYIVLFGVLVLAGCTKPGPGGKASINVDVIAGTVTAHTTKVYIKYDTQSSPGESADAYDDVKVTSSSGQAFFTNLKKGDYYIYAANDTISAGATVTIDKRIDVIDLTLQMK